jgi:hypothetical protein
MIALNKEHISPKKYLEIKLHNRISKFQIFITSIFVSSYTMSRLPPKTIQSETEIRNIFDHHRKALNEQKRKTHDKITEWEDDLIRQVQENATKQKAFVDAECENQISYLSTKRQEFVATASIHEKKDDREAICQLLDECRAVKVELAILEYPEQPTRFVQIKKVKQRTEVNPDSPRTDKSRENRADKKSTVNDNSTTDDNENARTVASARSTSTDSNQTK